MTAAVPPPDCATRAVLSPASAAAAMARACDRNISAALDAGDISVTASDVT
jgi:hypothetical protein